MYTDIYTLQNILIINSIKTIRNNGRKYDNFYR